jgi:acylglycerol lipase
VSSLPAPSHDYMTKVWDVTRVKKRASICLMHDFGRCSDTLFELAIQLALNGFVVHLIDLEGHGYSAGNRVNNLTIEKFHGQIANLLTHVDPELPCYLLGHGVGALAVNTLLRMNPFLS